MINWNHYFDHIYCINYIPYYDRRDVLENEFKRIGINVNADYFSWHETTDSPFYDQLLDSSSFKKEENNIWWKWKENKSIIRCGLSHYAVLKNAQIRNYKHILIFEDDIVFMKNIETIEKCLDNMPNDYDIILFDKFVCLGISHYKDLITNYSKNEYYAKYGIFNEYLCSCGFYALSDKYINHLISCQEHLFSASDHYINKINNIYDNLNRYFAIINLGVQKEYSSDKNYYDLYYKKLGLKKEWYNY